MYFGHMSSFQYYFQESLNDPGKKWIVLLGVVVIAIIVVAITVQVFRKRSGGSQFKYD